MNVKQIDLMIPGPVQLSHEVLQEMATPQVPHYGEEALTLFKESAHLVGRICQTEGNTILMNGSGSVAFDACVGSVVRDGDAVVACTNGVFGDRNSEIARCYGARVTELRAPEGSPITAEALARCLRDHPDATAVLIVHHETSTGVLNPLAEIGEVTKARGVTLIVDAVASLGIDPIEMDRWGVGLCASSSQKGVEAPAGLGFAVVNERGWKAIEGRTPSSHGWYMNLRIWKSAKNLRGDTLNAMGPIVTMPLNNIRALHRSLLAIMEEGLEERYQRHARIAQAVRKGVRAMGLKTLPEDRWASNGVTAVLDTVGMDVPALIAYLREEFSIEIGGALGPLAGRMFRIGHIGQSADPSFAVRVLFGIEKHLRRRGVPTPVGASLAGLAEI